MTPEEITAARTRLDKAWGDHGECRSCGWHAALIEYEIDDWEIEHAVEDNGGLLELPCISKELKEDDDSHRGVRVFIGSADMAAQQGEKGGA